MSDEKWVVLCKQIATEAREVVENKARPKGLSKSPRKRPAVLASSKWEDG
jgi:hypothetical protein